MDTETRIARLEQGQLDMQAMIARHDAEMREIKDIQYRIGVVLEGTLRLMNRMDNRLLAVEQKNGHEG